MPSGPLPDADGVRVMLLTRSGCHLCEQAIPVVRDVCDRAAVSMAEIDLDQCAADVRSAFTDHVPVTVVDGRVVSIWFVDPGALMGALGEHPLGTVERQAGPAARGR